jgi:hypothetical protein
MWSFVIGQRPNSSKIGWCIQFYKQEVDKDLCTTLCIYNFCNEYMCCHGKSGLSIGNGNPRLKCTHVVRNINSFSYVKNVFYNKTLKDSHHTGDAKLFKYIVSQKCLIYLTNWTLASPWTWQRPQEPRWGLHRVAIVVQIQAFVCEKRVDTIALSLFIHAAIQALIYSQVDCRIYFWKRYV